jgi:hypothetical protein
VNCCPSSLFYGSTLPPPSPLPCANKYSVNTYTVCKGRGWGSGPQTDKHLPQSPFTGHFIRRRHFALPSMSLIVLCSMVSNRLQCMVHTICSLSCAQYLNFYSLTLQAYTCRISSTRGRGSTNQDSTLGKHAFFTKCSFSVTWQQMSHCGLGTQFCHVMLKNLFFMSSSISR